MSVSVGMNYSGGHIVFALSVGLSVGLFAPTLIFCHNFCNIEESNFIFGMHVYLMELHILSGERSRSSFKVKIYLERCRFASVLCLGSFYS